MDQGLPIKNVRYVVTSFMMQHGLSDTREYEEIEQLALQGLSEELGIYSMPSVIVKRIKVPSHLTIAVPHDYVRYTKIGVCLGGSIYTLTLNDDLCSDPTRYVCCDAPVIDKQTSDSQFGIVPYDYLGNYHSAQFMIGGGINDWGYYREDKNNRTITLNQVCQGKEIVLEYIGSGNVNGQTLVPLEFVEPLKDWIYYAKIKFRDDYPANEKERRRMTFYQSSNEAKQYRNQFTLDELLDVMWSTSGHSLR